MRYQKFKILLWLILIFFDITSFSKNSKPDSEEDTLQYRLYTSDWRCWASGKCRGNIKANAKNGMATALESFLLNSSNRIGMALYGVQKQNWFFKSLELLREKNIDTRAVVDQSFGQNIEWLADNFIYEDTALLPDILGSENIVVDSNEDQSPRRSSIMHHKFIIRDDYGVWFGSTNLSHTCIGAEYNVNNAMVIKSKKLNRFFVDEFLQMFQHSRFSRRKLKNDKAKIVEYRDGSSVHVYFAPQDRPIENAIVPMILSAKKTIDISMFYLTEPQIEKALFQAHSENGVKIRIILDATSAAHPASIHQNLRSYGIPVIVENFGGKMHMKSAIVDRKHFIIGSMNWTKSGNTENDEAVVIVKNHPKISSEAASEFEDMWTFLTSQNISIQRGDPKAESPQSINSCFDGIDNDHDGRMDEQDSGCR